MTISPARRARRSRATFRSGGSARTATSTGRCCCWSRMREAIWRAPRSWSTAARWSRCAANPRKRTMIDFPLPPEPEDPRLRVRAFVETHVLPLESDPENFSEHENIPLARLAPVRAKARAAGLGAPQAPKEFGGMALPIVSWAVMYEEAARSVFGALAFNCMAPDDGNMNLLAKVGTPAPKEKWTAPSVDGKVISAFAMTEPAPGGGSDPGMIQTRAMRRGDKWVISGRKWFITGAGAAAPFIVGARTSDAPRHGLTAFLFHPHQPGWRVLPCFT